MNKKEISLPFIFAGLSFAFIVICLAVYLSGGKSKKWIARKIGIGALMLSLHSCHNTGIVRRTSCYLPMPIDEININQNTDKGIILNPAKNNTIKGHIVMTVPRKHIFTISTTEDKIVQENKVQGISEKREDFRVDFTVRVDKKIKDGEYILRLFVVYGKHNISEEPEYQFPLYIKSK